jgi:hypothetical protein
MEKDMRSLYELHDQSVEWINEIQFMSDEQVFLEHLLSAHFLDLSSPKLLDTTQKLIRKLKEVGTLGNDLMDKIQLHNKHLGVLIESAKKLTEVDLEMEHKSIKKDLDNYVLKFRYVKKKIFNIIKEIMKVQKRKLLINKT